MKDITLQISEAELREVTQAYGVIQAFLAKIVSPNELYNSGFLEGLDEAQIDVTEKNFVEVTSFADFVQ